MRKRDELADPKSCLNKAGPDEKLFVLIGRDPAAAATIRFWVKERLRIGKNRLGDQKIREAIRSAYDIDFGNGVCTINGATSAALASKAVGFYCKDDQPDDDVAACGRSCEEWVVFCDRVADSGRAIKRPGVRIATRSYICPCGRVWSVAIEVDSDGSPARSAFPPDVLPPA